MSESRFSQNIQISLDWGDLDTFGHINNIAFFKYVQTSRVNYWDCIKLTKLHKEVGIGPVLVSCKCDFKKVLYYPGQITVLSRVEYIRNTSFSIYHRIIDEKNRIAAEAHDIMVMFDYNKNVKIQFPEDLKKRVEEIEKRQF